MKKLSLITYEHFYSIKPIILSEVLATSSIIGNISSKVHSVGFVKIDTACNITT